MKVVVISGTPGVGKSVLAKGLVRLGFVRLDVSKHYDEISIGYDKVKKCYDVDLKKFERLVKRLNTSEKLVIDSHVAHLLPKKLVDLCIVLVCSDLKELEKRLVKRKYSKEKIKENLDAEIFQVCVVEAKEKGHKVVVVDVAGKTKKGVFDEVKGCF